MRPALRRFPCAVLLLLHLGLGTLFTLALSLLPMPARNDPARRLSGWWLRRAAAIVGLRVVARGQPRRERALLVANHISWLDILAIAAELDAAYVAKAEVGRWPVLGWLISSYGGTEFVQRGEPASFRGLLTRLTRRLGRGEPLVLFPEGTSGPSAVPGRFRPRLLQAAVDAQVELQPVAIYYAKTDGSLERAAFVGEDSFLDHLWALLAAGPVLAEVSFLPPISTAGREPRALAEAARRAVVRAVAQLELFEFEARHAVPPMMTEEAPAGSPRGA